MLVIEKKLTITTELDQPGDPEVFRSELAGALEKVEAELDQTVNAEWRMNYGAAQVKVTVRIE